MMMHAKNNGWCWAALLWICAATVPLFGGNLDPAGPPTSPTMKTLDEIEPRIPIDSVPFEISLSGSYYLTGDLVCSDACAIEVGDDHVTIDLCGFTLTGSGSSNEYGIYGSGMTDVTIKNGTVRGFRKDGIYMAGNTCKNVRVTNVCAMENGESGIYLDGYYYEGYYDGGGHLIQNCMANNNGLQAAEPAIYAGFNSIVEGCTVTNNSSNGIRSWSCCVVRNNTASHNGGRGIYAGYTNTVQNNSLTGNREGGLYAGRASTVTGNSVYNNENSYGIYGAAAVLIEGNNVYNTKDDPSTSGNEGDGIYANDGSRIVGNTIYENDGHGIFAQSRCLVQGNIVVNNNQLQTKETAGIYIYNAGMIKDNLVNGNGLFNIYVSSYQNVIIGNQVIGNSGSTGIYFGDSTNFYADNRASGNTTDFGGTLPSGTGDGGGNVSF